MAPRLSRWIAMTAVTAVLVAVLFLTTGGTPLLFIGYGEISWGEGERTPLQRRIEGVQRSLDRVRWRREALELRALLDEALRHTSADPAVFRWTGNTLALDPGPTAELQPLWNALPVRRAEIRTVVIVQGDRPGWYNAGATIDSTGLCVIRPNDPGRRKELLRTIRRMGGECLFAERFGLPGTGTTEWLRGLRSGLAWDHTRSNWSVLRDLNGNEISTPVWFAGRSGSLWRDGGGWRYRPTGRAEMSCLVGRAGQCEAATGVTAEGWPSTGMRWGYIDQRFPNALLPRDLLIAMGPDRFGRIWSSSEPIATSYRGVTGAPMDDWLGEWARRYAGPVERDNSLSLAGWVGALLWLALLGLLTRERLKQRTVT